MRYVIVMAILLTAFVGCATSQGNPAAPLINSGGENIPTANESGTFHDPHMLWGKWTLFFSEDHNSVDLVPERQSRFHLNATRFLEEYCEDCLEITSINNNGDGTIDLTVQITHPFPYNPEYTGFDVKGIIMFNGSHDVPFWSSYIYPYGTSTNLSYFHVSWAEIGDPEVLNADGYSVLWTPWWDSGSDMPIFNYWPGKYASGSPTANINAYLNFYTDEERHMFRVDGQVNRTYHISLPPGPVAAGYAIDACWCPPTVTPVTDPISDFPVSANQEEPYHFRYIINNDEPITYEPCCGIDWDGSDLRVELSKWYGDIPRSIGISFHPWPDWMISSCNNMQDCECPGGPPDTYCLVPWQEGITDFYEHDGNYRGVAVTSRAEMPGWIVKSITYDVFDYTIDLE